MQVPNSRQNDKLMLGLISAAITGFVIVFYNLNNQVIALTSNVSAITEQVKELKASHLSMGDRMRSVELGQHGKN
jgi:precorrin-3B methylase